MLNLDETWINDTSHQRKKWREHGTTNSVLSHIVNPRLSVIAALDNYGDVYMAITQVNTNDKVMAMFISHLAQKLNSKTLIYYDPMSPNIRVAKGQESVARAALFLLMKCKYGDDVHVQENKNYYTGNSSSSLQRMM